MKQSKIILSPKKLFVFKSLKRITKPNDNYPSDPTDQTTVTITSTATSGILIFG
ncbi:hypothetical protein [Pedobacter jeongneungensis]|uniref:hypothetical protein n=1 Tax=Pedobacter jeongneungensis TaxID=947309 RepID=UPI0013B3AEB1|nr:hypothetical protein [Pedobacter jeongneungensis]